MCADTFTVRTSTGRRVQLQPDRAARRQLRLEYAGALTIARNRPGVSRRQVRQAVTNDAHRLHLRAIGSAYLERLCPIGSGCH